MRINEKSTYNRSPASSVSDAAVRIATSQLCNSWTGHEFEPEEGCAKLRQPAERLVCLDCNSVTGSVALCGTPHHGHEAICGWLGSYVSTRKVMLLKRYKKKESGRYGAAYGAISYVRNKYESYNDVANERSLSDGVLSQKKNLRLGIEVGVPERRYHNILVNI
jgi:hypothetical protein